MKKLIEQEFNNKNESALTENGGISYATTGSACLDLFSHIGAMRNYYSGIIKMFGRAYGEDKLTAIKIMFYGRDIRGGTGERNTFRILLNYLANFYPEVLKQFSFINGIAKYGRY